MSDEESAQNPTILNDEAELARMGYKQELRRELGLMQNFGVSFSIISVITGIPSLFLYGLQTGGPAGMFGGWIVTHSLLHDGCWAGNGRDLQRSSYLWWTIFLGRNIAPDFPVFDRSSQAAMLSPPKKAPIASWITGWFNLLGQVAVTTGPFAVTEYNFKKIQHDPILGISFACASFISTLSTFNTGFVPTANTQIGVYAAVLFSQGLINTFGVSVLHWLNNISVAWHAIGTFSLVVAVLVKAPTHQSAHFVFQTFIDGTGGWSERASPAYVAIIGILMAQYTLTGFDASAHMTEETTNAAMSGSIGNIYILFHNVYSHVGTAGIIMAIGVSALLGLFLLLGPLFSIQDLDNTINSPTGQPVAQIFLDCVGEEGAIVLMIIVIGAMYFCGTFSVTSNSRMMFSFARDNGIPGSKFFAYVNTSWKSPIRTVWLACTLSFILGLPSLGSSVAFSAATSIATIGLYTSYGIPIALRLIYRKKFVRGPFHLGVFSSPIAAGRTHRELLMPSADVLYVTETPVTSKSLNYAVVAVGIVIVFSAGYWLLSARNWYTGPIRQIAAEESGVKVMEPGAVGEYQ
ncbi:hypothetical protein D9757_003140 [Collybiopsis confluens]|uniref:Amino acid transporter n=1 Tax=Collybiopsis confluens TaxID=2823264 RepID=A0A8H5MEM0_9AGAR|nr:hypothetical protein D9757_003140 [Collybiopsis confluens]